MGVPEVWIFSSPFIVIAYVKGECDDEDDSDNAAALPHPELQGLSVDDSLGSPTDPLGCHSSYCTDRLHLNTVSSLTKNIKKCQKHYFFFKTVKKYLHTATFTDPFANCGARPRQVLLQGCP